MLSPHRQPDLRNPIPQRITPRAVLTPEHRARLAGHLTTRDRWIARMLAEHRVLSTTQITQLAFPTRRATNLRLLQLYRWRVIDRFQPYIGAGRAPMHYVLDIAGAHTLAHEDGLDPTTLKFHPARSVGIAHSPRLAHTLGVNTLFTTLIQHARTHPGSELRAWWPETRCTTTWGDIVRPDSYGRWRDDGGEIEWFLEWDTGSYPLPRVAAKLADYARLATTTTIITPLLLCLPTTRRETHARTTLTQAIRALPHPSQVPIATTNTELLTNTNPAQAVWLPLNPTHPGRRPLTGLASQWPQLTPLPPAPALPGGVNPPGTLHHPAPMPPWQDSDLRWAP
ncbi:MAG: replication-relaxation family protein [Sciscionella sp.]